MNSDRLSLEAISDFVRDVVQTSPCNRLHHIDDAPIFDEPLLGVADGDDALFNDYKEIIGPHHLTPREILAALAPTAAQAEVIRVLCWVLPITGLTRRSNAAMTSGPSERWAHTYFYGEAFNNVLRHKVESYIREHGAIAVAPATSSLFRTVTGTSGLPGSTWSERHALFAAGLGTFGLCDGFITPAGKAMRCGSVVTTVPLPVTPRIFDSHTDACRFFARGTCTACVHRCPAGAITTAGHDKVLCKAFQDESLRPLLGRYGVEKTGCGLCQTRVPCESGFPS